MGKNIKLLKYKVINTKKDKKLIGEVFDFKKVKTKGGPGGDGGRKPPKPKAPAWFKEFSDNINKRLDKQEEFNMRIEKQVSDLRSDFNRVIKLNNLKH